MCAAKIRLSKKEQELATAADLILTKNRILQEWVSFLARWQEERVAFVKAAPLSIPEWAGAAPKISRGENYLGLPWVVLDYPRAYGNGHFAAIRTLFWWGRLCSVTLHVAGPFKKRVEPGLADAHRLAVQRDWRICRQEDEWQHHNGDDYYIAASAVTAETWRRLVTEKSFCKLACFFALEDWDTLPERMAAEWEALLELTRA